MLPEAAETFYAELHHGWYYLASRSMGLLPIGDVFPLSDEDWSVIERNGEQPVSLKKFNNGSGPTCVEERVGDAKQIDAHLWFSKQVPNLNVDFWPVLETWLRMGLNESLGRDHFSAPGRGS